jgi:uncharacterized membrane protein YkvA (DUF1232 family)
MNVRTRAAYPLDATMKEALGHIAGGIPALIKLLFRLMKDRQTPVHIKIWLGGTILYLISPVNFSLKRFKRFPLKMINYLDDLALVLIVVQKILDTCPHELLDAYWDYKIPIIEWKDMIYKVRIDLQDLRH